MSDSTTFYDALGANYDLLINWKARLAREGPFYRRLFEEHGVKSVLDMACGTGRHAAMFRDWGLDVTACDPSQEMLRVCRRNYGDRGIEFAPVGFGEIQSLLQRTFDAITCLGNSHPHLLPEEDIRATLDDYRASLRPGGVLVIQTLNYAQMLADNDRFMAPVGGTIGDRELLFLRVFDFGEQFAEFNMVTLIKEAGSWRHSVETTRHRMTFRADLERHLRSAGFGEIRFYGDFNREPYDERTSDHLLAVAAPTDDASGGRKPSERNG